MAWPVTPFVNFTDGITPWNAAFGNALQTAINGIVVGTYSLVGLTLDNVGGAVVTAPAGGISATGGAVFGGAIATTLHSSSSSLPNPAFSPGIMTRDTSPACVARIHGATASLVGKSIGVKAITRSAAGIYLVQLMSSAGAQTDIIAFPALQDTTSNLIMWNTTAVDTVRVQITTTLGAGGNTDDDFSLVVYYMS